MVHFDFTIIAVNWIKAILISVKKLETKVVHIFANLYTLYSYCSCGTLIFAAQNDLNLNMKFGELYPYRYLIAD